MGKSWKIDIYNRRVSDHSGLTLIELLVVVAIISVLAGIATINFLNAQIKAKRARVQADLHSTATAIGTYRIDSYHSPFDIVGEDGRTPGANDYWYISSAITSPIAYMTSHVFTDPFRQDKAHLPERYFRPRYVNYSLMKVNLNIDLITETAMPAYQQGFRSYGVFRLSAAGPDGKAGPWSPVSS